MANNNNQNITNMADLYEPIMAFHPGETLQEKLAEMNMSVAEFAEKTSIPEIIIQSVIDCNASVSADMALAFEQETLIPADFWLNSQHHYDEYVLAKEAKSYRTRIIAWQQALNNILRNLRPIAPSGKVASILV